MSDYIRQCETCGKDVNMPMHEDQGDGTCDFCANPHKYLKIVCAAIRNPKDSHIITGARHFDLIMHGQMCHYKISEATGFPIQWEQGFIDHLGNFHNRQEALKIVKANGQPLNVQRNGGNGEDLYSEGLY